MKNTQNNNFRFERKFFIYNTDKTSVEKLILYHPAFFSEIFHERYINNIYFDYIDMNNFYDNIIGNMERKKYRIRWYGDMYAKIEEPLLELKIKKGLVGTKSYYKLNQFELVKGINVSDLKDVVLNSKIDSIAMLSMHSQVPVMLNRYKRKYFISNDKKFRITIDVEQSFFRFNTMDNKFLQCIKDSSNVIVELKYDIENDLGAAMITNALPFRLTKSSKYVRGIELLYF
jgi:SPX domain protein involved in polyphosphate accumulation